MINGWPKGLIVGAVLVVGILFVIFSNPPHRLCTSKIEMLRELQKGKVFTSQGKAMTRPARILKDIETCKLGNSPGACFELFSTLRGLSRDLHGLPMECAKDVSEVGEVRGSLREGLTLLVQIAWGEVPPERGVGSVRQGWLEASDLALFCDLKDLYVRFFGKEELDQLRMSIFANLPGEAAVFTNGECVNCAFRKNALQVFSPEELWTHSLFSLRCEMYR